jgi:hypothetical protein
VIVLDGIPVDYCPTRQPPDDLPDLIFLSVTVRQLRRKGAIDDR